METITADYKWVPMQNNGTGWNPGKKWMPICTIHSKIKNIREKLIWKYKKKEHPQVLLNLQGFKQFSLWVSLASYCSRSVHMHEQFSPDCSSCSFPLVVTFEDTAHKISCRRWLLPSLSLMISQLTGACQWFSVDFKTTILLIRSGMYFSWNVQGRILTPLKVQKT